MSIAVAPVFTSSIATDPAATAAGYLTPTRWNQGGTWGGSDASFASAILTIGGSTAGAGIVVTGGTLTSDASMFNTTATLNNAGVAFSGIWKLAVTDTASASTSNVIEVTGGAAGTTPIFSVGKTGTLGCNSIVGPNNVGGVAGITVGNSNTVGWVVGSYYFANATTGAVTGTHRIVGAGTTTCLNFGGDTSSFPSWKRSGATFQARLADDSAYTTVDAKFSAEGTAGVASFGPSAVTSITVKDGIITAIS